MRRTTAAGVVIIVHALLTRPGSGFRAAALSDDGSPGKLLGKFDQEVERTLFVPHLQGG